MRNITDIDDKINARAQENNEPISALTQRIEKRFHQETKALGALTPNFQPRATENIAEIIALIERLIASGHAYEAEGHVLFSVKSWPEYGKFARKSPEDQIAGARVEVAPYKRDPADFILWKPSPYPTGLYQADISEEVPVM